MVDSVSYLNTHLEYRQHTITTTTTTPTAAVVAAAAAAV